MTKPQLIYFQSALWPNACKSQGWKPSDRPLRLKVLSEVCGRLILSAKDVNEKAEFDQVKAHCLRLTDSLAGAHEDGDPDPGEARRLRHVIADQLACLRVCFAALERTDAEAEAYLGEILRDKFNHAMREWQGPIPLTAGHQDGVPDWVNLLTATPNFRHGQERPSDLQQLVFTLGRVINGKGGFRAQANLTVADMQALAAPVKKPVEDPENCPF
jgi:hypothetical protein